MDLPSEGELALRILLATVLGLIVGIEREIRDRPAGMRTHAMVSLGACLFAVISAYGFGEFETTRSQSNIQVDVTRVASNIVSGVGFLGGGAILKYGATVRGLTTAAGLWVAAAIGLGIGVGSYTVTLVATAAVLLSLVGLRPVRQWVDRRFGRAGGTVTLRLPPGTDLVSAVAAVSGLEGLDVRSISVQDDDDAVVVEVQTGSAAATEKAVRLLEEQGDVLEEPED